MADPWNHNTHYHPLLLRLVPRGGATALDVGSGDGRFAALLAQRFTEVTALDPDPTQVAAASERCRDLSNVNVLQGNFLESGLPADHFDVVTALAAFHRMDFPDAAAEAARVLKPGGRLLVLGVWTDNETKADLALNVLSVALNRFLQALRGPDAMAAPATLQRTTWRDVRGQAATYLPGSRLRRRPLWRYSLVWNKPRVA